MTDKQRQIIVSFSIVLGISVAAFIAIKFASNQVRNVIANKEENSSFGDKQHSTWAKQLKMAFDNDGWWGTDEQAIRQVLRAMPSQEDFQKVQISYRKLYKGSNLIEDLTDELKATEFNEMLAILQSKPQKAKDAGVVIYNPHAWAKRLYNAMSIYYMGFIPGTDEEAITAVFSEMKSKQAFKDTEQAYESLYSTSLGEDLDGDLDWSMDWRAIINKKPNN
ncbi:MAG: hypothetical protein JKY09_08495 [Crocinitomicaceae bacterium]|nr:hypothetical protein [Crocinitomicaceae bacterium]